MAAKAIKILIPLIILLVPTYLVRFSVLGIPTNVLEVLVLAAFISYLAKGKRSFWNFYERNKIIGWSVLAVFVGLIISTAVGGDYRIGLGIIKGWFAVPLVFAWILHEEIKTGEDLKTVLKWLYLGILGVALAALGYYFFGELTYDERLKAFYLSPNHLAMHLAPGIIIGIYFIKEIILHSNRNISLVKSRRMMSQLAYASSRYKLIFFAISLFIVVVCFYFTYSYAAWLAVVSSLIIVAIVKNKKISKSVILVSLIILLSIFISQWNTEKFANLKDFTRSSFESRIMIWKSAGKILDDNPLWGIGPGNFQEKYLEYQQHFPPYLEWAVPQPHNLYLAFWLQAGLLGLAGFLILIIKWLQGLLTCVKKQKSSKVAAVLLGIMLYILIHGLADTPYWKNDLAMIFWIIFALGINILRNHQHPE
jgi:O-antigen ligase